MRLILEFLTSPVVSLTVYSQDDRAAGGRAVAKCFKSCKNLKYIGVTAREPRRNANIAAQLNFSDLDENIPIL
jgi:hypothetical protein